MNQPSGDGGTGTGRAERARPAPPRWVRLFAAIAAVLILLFLALHLTGHGFGHHAMMEHAF